jgi:hypothetical protein
MPPAPPTLLIIHLRSHNVSACIPARLNQQYVSYSEQQQQQQQQQRRLSITERPKQTVNNHLEKLDLKKSKSIRKSFVQLQ